MANTIFEQTGGTYTQVGDYLLPNLSLTGGRRKESEYRRLGNATQTIFEATP